MGSATHTDTSIPVICLQKHREIWKHARASLGGHAGFVLVRATSGLDEIASLCQRIGPAILLTDSLFLDRLARPRIRKLWGSGRLRVLIITNLHETDHSIERYIRAGCSGVLTLRDSPETWRKAMKSVASDELWIPRKIASRMLRELVLSETGTSFRKLTPRETQVLELIARGHSNRDIGTQLFITKETVRWHVRSLYSKLGVTDRESAGRHWRPARADSSTAMQENS